MSGASSARFEVLSAVLLRMQVVWNVTLGQGFSRCLNREQQAFQVSSAGEVKSLFFLAYVHLKMDATRSFETSRTHT